MKTINVTEKEVQAAFAAAKSEETKQVLTTLFGQQKETAKPTLDNYKQFDLQEYLKNPNRKVVTRDGRSVRIICTDRIGDLPIIALIHDGINEFLGTFMQNGVHVDGVLDGLGNERDLFFVPEKKEGWANLYDFSEGPYLGSVYSSKEVAESMSKNCGLHPYIATVKIEWEE